MRVCTALTRARRCWQRPSTCIFPVQSLWASVGMKTGEMKELRHKVLLYSVPKVFPKKEIAERAQTQSWDSAPFIKPFWLLTSTFYGSESLCWCRFPHHQGVTMSTGVWIQTCGSAFAHFVPLTRHRLCCSGVITGMALPAQHCSQARNRCSINGLHCC